MIDPNRLFFDKNSSPSYRKTLWEWSEYEFSNWELKWNLWTSENLIEYRNIQVSTLDISCYTKLRNMYPDLEFVSRKISYKRSGENMSKSKEIIWSDIAVKLQSKSKSWRDIFTCEWWDFVLEFTWFSANELQSSDLNFENIHKDNIEKKSFKVTQDLLNIFWFLNGPEIIHTLLGKEWDLSQYEIVFLRQAEPGLQVAIGDILDLNQINQEKIYRIWPKDMMAKNVLYTLDQPQQVIAFLAKR